MMQQRLSFGGCRVPASALAFGLALLVAVGAPVWAADSEPGAAQGGVVVIPIHGTIDLGLAGFVDRSVTTAEAMGAQALVVDIQTFGGRVDAAVRIRDRLLATSLPTIAYINPRAISAGALISLACDQIYMAGGGTIGAASPVSIGPGGDAQALGEKEVSYVRTEFRATAERNGYSPLIAEAMVDKDATAAVFQVPDGVRVVSVADIERVAEELGIDPSAAKTYSAEGKLLSLTTDDALSVGLAAGRADTLEDLLTLIDLAEAGVTRLQTTWSENLVRFLSHPVVTGLLLSLGMLGLFVELRQPGWGVPGTLGVVALTLFFGAQYLVGLAEWQEVLLLGIGLGLLVLEIFVIPGFGIAGVTGTLCLVAAIYLALVDVPIPRYSWDYQQLSRATTSAATALLSGCALIVLVFRYLPQSRWGRRFMLVTELGVDSGYIGVSLEAMPAIGAHGTAYTVLRPAGRVQIGERLVDAQTAGDFIEQGTPVQVIQIVGNAVVVETVREDASV